MAEVAYDSYMNENLGSGAGAAYLDDYKGFGDSYTGQQGEGYLDGDSEDSGEITQQGCWEIITSFFEENGLVQQQLSSFDEFVNNTIQELVEENKSLTLEQSDQHTGLEGDISVRRTGVDSDFHPSSQSADDFSSPL
jgi:DNA-directed RNA polymerase II subunit RPB2